MRGVTRHGAPGNEPPTRVSEATRRRCLLLLRECRSRRAAARRRPRCRSRRGRTGRAALRPPVHGREMMVLSVIVSLTARFVRPGFWESLMHSALSPQRCVARVEPGVELLIDAIFSLYPSPRPLGGPTGSRTKTLASAAFRMSEGSLER